MLKVMGLMALVALACIGVIFYLFQPQQGADGAAVAPEPAAGGDKAKGLEGDGGVAAGGSFRLLAVSGDGNRLAGLCESTRSATVWDTVSGQAVRTVRYEGDFFPDRIRAAPEASLSLSDDGSRLVFKGANQALIEWDLSRGLGHQRKAGQKVAVSRDASVMASVNFIHLTVEDLVSGEVLGKTSFDSPAEIGKFIVSSDGRYLFGETYEFDTSGGDSHRVHIYLLEVASGKRYPLARLDRGERAVGVQDQVRFMTFSRDGERVAMLDADGTVTLWDVSSRRQVWQAGLKTSRGLELVRVSPDHRTVAAYYDESPLGRDTRRWQPVIVLWTVGDPNPRTYRTTPGIQVADLAFSPDGQTLYVNGPKRTVQALDLSNLQVTRTFSAPHP